MDTVSHQPMNELQWHRGNELFSQLDAYLHDLYDEGLVNMDDCKTLLEIFATKIMHEPIRFGATTHAVGK